MVTVFHLNLLKQKLIAVRSSRITCQCVSACREHLFQLDDNVSCYWQVDLLPADEWYSSPLLKELVLLMQENNKWIQVVIQIKSFHHRLHGAAERHLVSASMCGSSRAEAPVSKGRLNLLIRAEAVSTACFFYQWYQKASYQLGRLHPVLKMWIHVRSLNDLGKFASDENPN